MGVRPDNRRYNEFDQADKAKIDQLALTSAKAHKEYIDKEIKPFRLGRTIIMTGVAGGYGNGAIEVSIAGADGKSTVQAVGISEKQAKKVKGKTVRVLLDTRSKTIYYDDQVF